MWQAVRAGGSQLQICFGGVLLLISAVTRLVDMDMLLVKQVSQGALRGQLQRQVGG